MVDVVTTCPKCQHQYHWDMKPGTPAPYCPNCGFDATGTRSGKGQTAQPADAPVSGADRADREGPSIEERVIDIVSEQLGVSKDQITSETSFVNDLGADSLDTVELVMELEEEFDISIPDDTAEKIQTVGQAIEHIQAAVDSTGEQDQTPD